jgi:hypothetical protein
MSAQPTTGTAPQQEDVAKTLSAPGTHSVSSQILGQVFNPLVRRFSREIGKICYQDPEVKGDSVEIVVHCDPLLDQAIKTWIRFDSHVEYSPLSSCPLAIELVPGPSAPMAQLMGRYAWIPSVETYPETYEALQEYPTNCTFVAGPVYVGGRVNKEVLPVAFSYNMQKQIKPLPHIGGPPKLALRVTISRCMVASKDGICHIKIANGEELYTLNLVAELVKFQ